MAETTDVDTSAEKAYAAAAEAVSPKPTAAAPASETVEFPSKVVRAAEPKAPAAPAPVKAPKAKATKVGTPKAKAPKAKAPKASPVKTAAKPAALKAATVTRKAKPKTAAKVKIKPTAPIKPKTVIAAKPAVAPKSVFQQLKDKTMDTAEFTTKMKSAVAEVQVKAREAFDKGAAAFGEYNEFSKGNLEAVVESGKILASGMQSLGTTLVADGKTAFETLTAEVKELASVKSPTDFFKLQAAFVRRNFDLAIAQTSKNSEAVLKLANEAAAPISGRVSLAVEKIKKAA